MDGPVRRRRCLEMLEHGRGITDVVKVVTGMRRAGKSTLLRIYMDDLRRSGVPDGDIISINFEDFEYQGVGDSEALNGILLDLIGESGEKYVFLDEIQNVRGWERSVSGLIQTGRCDIYITGSNASMLSSELSTHISGRYVEVPVLPLSFSEYLELHPGDRRVRFDQYLRFGALPEVDPSWDPGFCYNYLDNVYGTVLRKDIMMRMGLGDQHTLESIARFLYSNIGNETNVDRIARELGVSNDKVKKYVSMLREAFLFYDAERYDIVGRRPLKTNGKFYASDLGLRIAALGAAAGSDISRPVENIVYLELVRRGYTVRVGSYHDMEVDFTATRQGELEYFQVCLTMLAEGTRRRELGPLEDIGDNHPKTVLTMDEFGLGDHEGIRIVNLLDWLLSERL